MNKSRKCGQDAIFISIKNLRVIADEKAVKKGKSLSKTAIGENKIGLAKIIRVLFENVKLKTRSKNRNK